MITLVGFLSLVCQALISGVPLFPFNWGHRSSRSRGGRKITVLFFPLYHSPGWHHQTPDLKSHHLHLVGSERRNTHARCFADSPRSCSFSGSHSPSPCLRHLRTYNPLCCAVALRQRLQVDAVFLLLCHTQVLVGPREELSAAT